MNVDNQARGKLAELFSIALAVMATAILISLVVCLTAVLAQAQTIPPKEPCNMPDSDSTPFTLQEPASLKLPIAYQVYQFATVSGSSRMQAGRPIEVYRVHDNWSCGYYVSSTGAGPVWVLSSALRPVAFSPNPPVSAWLGTWQGGEGRVIIRAATSPGTLALKGTAQWHGQGDLVHFGDFSGNATPQGNQLHFAQGPDADHSCTIDLVLFDRYIVARDNDFCGGMNVRFQGIWHRSAARH